LSNIFCKTKGLWSKIKHKEIFFAAVLSLILIFVYFSDQFKTNEKEDVELTKDSNYCSKMSEDLLDAVCLMTNSQNCKVIINWEAGVESVIAYTTSSSGSSTTKSPEIVSNNGQSSPIILKEQFPKAVSVAVVCPTNTSITTKMNIRFMVGTLLGVDVNNVAIYSC
jgi:hypothetical protein